MVVTTQGVSAAVALVTARLGEVDIAQTDLTGNAADKDVMAVLVLMHSALLAATFPPEAADRYLRQLGRDVALIEGDRR
ncbi:MAG: hypothetical protein JOZ47_14090 [Kutzneria sp.]|nr:hypothetical protein [Kutzneria sp.]MBV9846182.1 hypothetical protein [Kutzneria sp.]